jgi:hypothetical protein
MDSFDRRLGIVELHFCPAPPTTLDRKRLRLLEEGLRRLREDREAQGLSPTHAYDEEDLRVELHTSQGIQLTIDILNDGRERNHLRWLQAKQISDSTAPATGDAQCP